MIFLKPEEFLDNLNRIYSDLKIRVLEILPEADVDHIGSSAINGAISKGDLDILVRVQKSHIEKSIEQIKKLGFKEKQGTLRTDSLCMLFTNEFKEDVAIQLIARGSEFEDFIRFRDILNSNPKLVIEYNQLKIESEGLTADQYRLKKSLFIEQVLKSKL